MSLFRLVVSNIFILCFVLICAVQACKSIPIVIQSEHPPEEYDNHIYVLPDIHNDIHKETISYTQNKTNKVRYYNITNLHPQTEESERPRLQEHFYNLAYSCSSMPVNQM